MLMITESEFKRLFEDITVRDDLSFLCSRVKVYIMDEAPPVLHKYNDKFAHIAQNTETPNEWLLMFENGELVRVKMQIGKLQIAKLQRFYSPQDVQHHSLSGKYVKVHVPEENGSKELKAFHGKQVFMLAEYEENKFQMYMYRMESVDAKLSQARDGMRMSAVSGEYYLEAIAEME